MSHVMRTLCERLQRENATLRAQVERLQAAGQVALDVLEEAITFTSRTARNNQSRAVLGLHSALATPAPSTVRILPPSPSFPDECVASGQSCSYGPHGPDGEMQCQYCGSPPDEPLTDEQIEPLFRATRARPQKPGHIRDEWFWFANGAEQGARAALSARAGQVAAPAMVPLTHRLLASGIDKIEATDEFLSEDTTTWAIDPNGIFVGMVYGGRVLRPARRRINGLTVGEKGGA